MTREPARPNSPAARALRGGEERGRREEKVGGCLFCCFFFFCPNATNHKLFSRPKLILLASVPTQYTRHASLMGTISCLTANEKHTHTHVYKMATHCLMGAIMSRDALELDLKGLGQVSRPGLLSASPLQSVAVFVYLSGCSNSQQGHAPVHFSSA